MLASISDFFLMQFVMFLVPGMTSDFHLKLGCFYYVLRILLKLSVAVGILGMAVAGKGKVSPHSHPVGGHFITAG